LFAVAADTRNCNGQALLCDVSVHCCTENLLNSIGLQACTILLCTVQVEREIATRLIEIAALKKETDSLSKARLQKLEEEVRILIYRGPPFVRSHQQISLHALLRVHAVVTSVLHN
jgi:hypothetical protein